MWHVHVSVVTARRNMTPVLKLSLNRNWNLISLIGFSCKEYLITRSLLECLETQVWIHTTCKVRPLNHVHCSLCYITHIQHIVHISVCCIVFKVWNTSNDVVKGIKVGRIQFILDHNRLDKLLSVMCMIELHCFTVYIVKHVLCKLLIQH